MRTCGEEETETRGGRRARFMYNTRYSNFPLVSFVKLALLRKAQCQSFPSSHADWLICHLFNQKTGSYIFYILVISFLSCPSDSRVRNKYTNRMAGVTGRAEREEEVKWCEEDMVKETEKVEGQSTETPKEEVESEIRRTGREE